MNIEKVMSPEGAEGRIDRGKSPEKIMKGLELFMKQFESVEVSGQEHVKEIPPEKKVVIAVSHAGDFDMPLAYYALGNDMKIRFTDESVLHRITGGDPITYTLIKLGGEENFFPIDYKKKDKNGPKRRGSFNPENFVPMKEAMDEGDAVLVAAHNPSWNKKMEEQGGYADVYLAQLAEAMVLPVAVDVETKEEAVTIPQKLKAVFTGRPKARVTIGEPIELPKIMGIERMAILMEKNKGGILTKDEIAEFHRLKEELREQSGVVMDHIAQMMPEEKRSGWGEDGELEETAA